MILHDFSARIFSVRSGNLTSRYLGPDIIKKPHDLRMKSSRHPPLPYINPPLYYTDIAANWQKIDFLESQVFQLSLACHYAAQPTSPDKGICFVTVSRNPPFSVLPSSVSGGGTPPGNLWHRPHAFPTLFPVTIFSSPGLPTWSIVSI